MNISISKYYQQSAIFLFLIYLFLTLTLGRAFAVVQVFQFGKVPFFGTEIILLLSLPLLIARYKIILSLPRRFLILLGLYLCLSLLYLVVGLSWGNLYALRDVVLCGYALFLFLTIIIFSEHLNIFLIILLCANLTGLSIGISFYIFHLPCPGFLEFIILKAKTFQYALYYGIALSFLIPLTVYTKNVSRVKIFSLLAAINLFTLVFLGIRTAWVACVILFLFLFFILRVRFIKIALIVVTISVIISFSLHFSSFNLEKEKNPGIDAAAMLSTNVGTKIKSISAIIKDVKEIAAMDKPIKNPILDPAKASESYGNAAFRLRVWHQAIEFGLRSPIFGRGYGVYPEYLDWFGLVPLAGIGVNSKVIPTHNHLISIFYKMGFLGLFLFLAVNIYVFAYGLTYLKTCANAYIKSFLTGALAAFVYWHAMAFFFDVIDSPPSNVFLWIIMGLIFAAVKIGKKGSG